MCTELVGPKSPKVAPKAPKGWVTPPAARADIENQEDAILPIDIKTPKPLAPTSFFFTSRLIEQSQGNLDYTTQEPPRNPLGTIQGSSRGSLGNS